MKRKWTVASAESYIQRAKEKGLTYWSAYDYLKNHSRKESDKQVFVMDNNKKMKRCFLWVRHKIIYIKGFGYRCKHCGKTKSQLKMS